jgi:hypothetical protein
MPTAEKPTAKKFFMQSSSTDESKRDDGFAWNNYKNYLSKTSILFPIPPAIYRPLPRWVKTWALLDLPIYRFDEKKDGQQAIEEEKHKRERRSS